MNGIESIQQIVCETMAWPDDVLADTPLCEGAGWDSVNQLRVLLALEARVGLRIPMKRFIVANTIAEISAVVDSLSVQKSLA